ncbi:MAG: hypothetical protein WEC84_01345 [Candidatus Andersenbacteria bacterium]
MARAVLVQSPAVLYEVIPHFYHELKKHKYFDVVYLVTDQPAPYGLDEKVVVIQLEKDLGRANNFLHALQYVKEDIFVMMCDDHVVRQDSLNLDPYYEIMQAEPNLGRLQLSPPSSNYYRFLQRTQNAFFIPDDTKPWYSYDRRYRWYMNFQPSLWRKEFFRYCIQGGENRNKLEIRAGKRARQNTEYVSGFIPHHAVRYDNFFASCKVHHADPRFDKQKSMAHYREEFLRYAMERGISLDENKRVFVKRRSFSASVPYQYYRDHYGDDEALQKYAHQPTFKSSAYAFARSAKRQLWG